MRNNPIALFLLWLVFAFILRSVLRKLLKSRFPTWCENRKRDAESVAAAGGFLLALGLVVGVVVVLGLVWPT